MQYNRLFNGKTVTKFLSDAIKESIPECRSFHYNNFQRLQAVKQIKYPAILRFLRDTDQLNIKYAKHFDTHEVFGFAVEVKKDPDVREGNDDEEQYEMQCLQLLSNFLKMLDNNKISYELNGTSEWWRRSTSSKDLVLLVGLTIKDVYQCF